MCIFERHIERYIIHIGQNLDHGDFVYIGMKLKEWAVLNGNAVMFDTYIMCLI